MTIDWTSANKKKGIYAKTKYFNSKNVCINSVAIFYSICMRERPWKYVFDSRKSVNRSLKLRRRRHDQTKGINRTRTKGWQEYTEIGWMNATHCRHVQVKVDRFPFIDYQQCLSKWCLAGVPVDGRISVWIVWMNRDQVKLVHPPPLVYNFWNIWINWYIRDVHPSKK